MDDHAEDQNNILQNFVMNFASNSKNHDVDPSHAISFSLDITTSNNEGLTHQQRMRKLPR